MPDGDYTLQLTQRYGTATSSPTAPITVRIDTAGRTRPRGSSRRTTARAPTRSPHHGPVDAGVRPYISSGVPEQFATVHVVADVEPGPISTISSPTPIYCDAITDAAGNWACTPSTPMTFGDFYGFTVYGVDEAGNTGISPDPEFGSTSTCRLPRPTPKSSSRPAHLELTGTGAAGGSIHASFSNGQSCDAVVNSGYYECDVTLAPATDGTYSVDLTQTVGTSSSPITGVTVILDQTPPTGYPSFSAPWSTGSSPARAVSNSSTPTFSGGGADPGAEVTVLVADDPDGYPADATPSQPVCSATAGSDGSWSCEAGAEIMSTGDSYSVGVEQRDQANNAGPAAVATFAASPRRTAGRAGHRDARARLRDRDRQDPAQLRHRRDRRRWQSARRYRPLRPARRSCSGVLGCRSAARSRQNGHSTPIRWAARPSATTAPSN